MDKESISACVMWEYFVYTNSNFRSIKNEIVSCILFYILLTDNILKKVIIKIYI